MYKYKTGDNKINSNKITDVHQVIRVILLQLDHSQAILTTILHTLC